MDDILKQVRDKIRTSNKRYIQGLIDNTYLDNIDKSILGYRLQGKTTTEAQMKLCLSESTYQRRWQKILKKLYNAM